MRSVVPGFSVSAAGLLALSVAGHISAQELERPHDGG